ncbi:MAG: hypothetical protein A3G35_00880 [candidate division NC10 bacterium RIFCSPLOWO2_12_FULL_66_18]|nr:MAG: hypothetical protein A3G35_00880 [candidate division NC10 bacterium RIFCSPLOWO2_12_FULL_66_18]
MSSETIATLVKMLESLHETAQDLVVLHVREYIEDLRDELQWDVSFDKTQEQLAAAARRAKQEIAEGRAKTMDYDQL